MKFNILFLGLILSSCTYIPSATVKITNLGSNSGGSGTIINSSDTGSTILTNAHVCGVVKQGGIVHTLDGVEHAVVGYTESANHDLCMIKVEENLGIDTNISATPPRMYDKALVSGHPKLLPNIITEGRFSRNQMIQVMVGSRACTEAETADPSTGLFCMLIGKLPLIKTYEAALVSALIQPGSSGSGIYNSRGEIAAVVFAGSGEIGFGYAVPYEYVRDFVKTELKHAVWSLPNYVAEYGDGSKERRELSKKVISTCASETLNEVQENLCALFKRSISINDMVIR